MKRNKIIISGCTGGGIGTTLVNHFLNLNWIVLANSRSKKKLLQFWAKEIKMGNLIPIPGDISDHRIFKNFLNIRVDAIINNAAESLPKIEFQKLDLNDWEKEYRTTIIGSFNMVKCFVEPMKHNKFGRIVNISSSAALKGTQGRSLPYATFKAGLLGFTKQLALDLSEYNITVNSISPSQILTPRVMKKGRRSEYSINNFAKKHIPLARPAYPMDIVYLVEYLVSEKSGYITGTNFSIDGGQSLALQNKTIL